MTKQQLRKIFKQKRTALSPEIQAVWNERIFSHLKSLDWTTCQYCHIYLPIEKNHEPNTLNLIHWLQHRFPNMHLVVSSSHLDDLSMSHYLLDETVRLLPNRWGIPEPVDGIEVKEELIDVVLVPMLVCDQSGNRVGYGKGFYDRFLQKCRPDILKIALSFFEPIEQVDDTDIYDIPVDVCISPSEIYYFK